MNCCDHPALGLRCIILFTSGCFEIGIGEHVRSGIAGLWNGHAVCIAVAAGLGGLVVCMQAWGCTAALAMLYLHFWLCHLQTRYTVA